MAKTIWKVKNIARPQGTVVLRSLNRYCIESGDLFDVSKLPTYDQNNVQGELHHLIQEKFLEEVV